MADRWRGLRFPRLDTFRELSDVRAGSCERHVLDIRLPKVEEVTPREIKIELG